jgi:hypothetical protein
MERSAWAATPLRIREAISEVVVAKQRIRI